MVSHDPLCPWRQVQESYGPDRWLAGVAICECDLITKVREDMLAKCIAAVEALYVNDNDPNWDWPIQAAERALRALSTNAGIAPHVSEQRHEVDTPPHYLIEHINLDTP